MKEFMIGCNYWDSASGTDMWKNWQPKVINDDLQALSECGVKYLRIFPIWRDFQPVKKLYWFKNNVGEYVIGDDEESMTYNQNGISSKMVNHFREFAEIAQKYNMKLIVSLVTGWMSGRMFVPSVIEGKNLLTDPEVLMWTNRYIKGLVSEIKDIDNIVMWELGNECNGMSKIESRYEAYAWIAFVRNAIAAIDASRPISAGMHSLSADENGIWQIADLGEMCDMMTTHPYPSPTIKCDWEPVNRMRTTILPTAISEWYSSIGKKHCLLEESGTFSSTLCNEQMTADFMRVNLLSAWANNLTGYLWWCGMEHLRLKKAPYAWSMMERELGLLKLDRTPKAVGKEMKRIGDVIKMLPTLPAKDVDAICVLPKENKLEKAMGAYILAKQAGFNIKTVNNEVPEADYYIIPCIEFWAGMNMHPWEYVLDRVENHGANLLLTFSGGLVTEFEKVCGLSSLGYRKNIKNHRASFEFGDINYSSDKELLLKSVGAEVLAVNEEDNIVFSRNRLGKGYVYALNFNLETMAFSKPEGFNPEVTESYYKIYEIFGEDLKKNYVLNTTNPYIGITQSKIEDGSYIVTAINYSDKPQTLNAEINNQYNMEVLYGNDEIVDPCDAVIMKFVR